MATSSGTEGDPITPVKGGDIKMPYEEEMLKCLAAKYSFTPKPLQRTSTKKSVAEMMGATPKTPRNPPIPPVRSLMREASISSSLQTASSHAAPLYPVPVPKIPLFSGDEPQPKNEVSYPEWLYEIRCLIKDPEIGESQVLQAIRRSLRGTARKIISQLGEEVKVDAYVEKLNASFSEVGKKGITMQEFFNSKQRPGESITAFGCRLESVLETAFEGGYLPRNSKNELMCERLWSGLHSTTLKTQTRHKVDTIQDYNTLLKIIREVDKELKLEEPDPALPSKKPQHNPVFADQQNWQQQLNNIESKMESKMDTKLADVRKSRTTPYHPMGNGSAERFNRTLLKLLGTLREDQKSDWKTYIPSLVQAYNSTRNEATGYSPHFLMFGWHPRLSIDTYLGTGPGSEEAKSPATYISKLRNKMKYAYKVAGDVAKKRADINKRNYDKRITENKLEIGDIVLVRKVHLQGRQKLADKWERDPYVILDIPDIDVPVFRVQLETGKGPVRTLHRNLLLPFVSIPPTEPIETTATLHRKKETNPAARPRVETVSGSESSTSEDSSDSQPYIVPQRRHSWRMARRQPVVRTPPDRNRTTNPLNGGGTIRSEVTSNREPLDASRNTSGDRTVDSTASRISSVADRTLDVGTPTTGVTETAVKQFLWENQGHHRNDNFRNHCDQPRATTVADSRRSPIDQVPIPRISPRRPVRQRRPPDRFGEWAM